MGPDDLEPRRGEGFEDRLGLVLGPRRARASPDDGRAAFVRSRERARRELAERRAGERDLEPRRIGGRRRNDRAIARVRVLAQPVERVAARPFVVRPGHDERVALDRGAPCAELVRQLGGAGDALAGERVAIDVAVVPQPAEVEVRGPAAGIAEGHAKPAVVNVYAVVHYNER